MAGKKKKGLKIPGLSFSPKRALGISAIKAKISRKIGIPLTKGGRQRKMGKMLGCCIPLAILSIAIGGATMSLGYLITCLLA
ncbi:MAG: hypothetical protein ACO1RA_00595 [Planctomycetaceae bacterium]